MHDGCASEEEEEEEEPYMLDVLLQTISQMVKIDAPTFELFIY